MSKTNETESGGIGETIWVLIQALILAVIIRSVIVQPFSIPSGSMRPTLLEGDYFASTKWSYGYSKHSLPFGPNLFEGRILEGKPERGDVVVFKLPSNPRLDYIKRVIGLPGETIQVRDGQIFINNEPVKREQRGQINDVDVTEENRPVDVYTETLPNGVTYDTLDLAPNTQGDNTREFVVPEGHYFMMGDNRDNSSDSRFGVGFVPAENLVGKAGRIFFSIANGSSPLEIWRWPSDVRLERLFKSSQK